MAVKTQSNAGHAQLKKLRMDDFFDHLDLLGKARVSQQPLDRTSYNLAGRYFRQRLSKRIKNYLNLIEGMLNNPVVLQQGIARNQSVKTLF